MTAKNKSIYNYEILSTAVLLSINTSIYIFVDTNAMLYICAVYSILIISEVYLRNANVLYIINKVNMSALVAFSVLFIYDFMTMIKPIVFRNYPNDLIGFNNWLWDFDKSLTLSEWSIELHAFSTLIVKFSRRMVGGRSA